MWFGSKRRRSLLLRLTFLCALILTIGTLYLVFSPEPNSTQDRAGPPGFINVAYDKECKAGSRDGHKLAVIIPFRDRFEELLEFVPHIRTFLWRQKICHEVFVISQVDSLRFNRGALINIGYWLGVNSSCDYIAMHDVDLLPLNDDLSYSYPSAGPRHLAAPGLHPKYNYTNFIGGILIMTNEQFTKVNGVSNRFWGWGREDDELFRRLNESKLVVYRPVNITTGNETFKHNHENSRRRRDNIRYGRQTKMRKDRSSGLHHVEYSVLSRHVVKISEHAVNVISVELRCNIRDTPWCMTPRQLAATMKSLRHSMPPWQFKEIDAEVKAKMSYDEYL